MGKGQDAMRAEADRLMSHGETKDAFRNYVTERDDQRFDLVPDGHLKLDVSHSNLEQRWHNIGFDADVPLEQIKDKLYRHGGTSCWAMDLYLRRGPGDTIFMQNCNLTLHQYGAKHGMEIFIQDNDPHSLSQGGGLEDVSLVEKYEITEEDYDKREQTVRKQIAAKRMAEKKYRADNPDLFPPRPETPQASRDAFHAAAELVDTEEPARCECQPGGRRGIVKYFGSLPGRDGSWVGVELDEPQGKNDGTKNGRKMFECKGEGYGLFSRCENVEVGDFPEKDPFDFSDDEI